jgi:type IX secretion system PorP/SprF family membrane protein
MRYWCCKLIKGFPRESALFFSCLLFILNVQAQDPVFSQFFAAPLELNPAFAGNTEGGKMALNYRNQWPLINQAYVTYAASYDQFFPYLNSGFGLMVLADNAGQGLYKTTDISAFYAYHLKLNKTFNARLGIEAGWINTRVDWAKLIFLDQIDPEFGAVSPGGLPYPSDEIPPETGNDVSVFDVSAGLLIFNEQFYGGISLKHLNTPQISFLQSNTDIFSGLPLRMSIHGGAEIDLFRVDNRGRRAFTAPNFQYIKQGVFSQLNIGTIFRYYLVGTGIWYRHTSSNPDALIFMMEGRYDKFRITYTYDMTLSRLARTGGAHEISIIMNFDNQQKGSRYNDCFNMFR